ncbi:uncharacterized protein JCM6883_001575 [Sporobolomyces salmoneus]|uniref:uncharacterized protein n=1 Tax=Sporobolomyces salmoneus TaxID=183962 RepID=UPI003180C86D
MRNFTASSISVLLGLPLVFAGLFDSPQPLLAFSHPKSFLGLKDEFTKRVDTVAFLPGIIHPCGTLTIIALDESDSPSKPTLEFTDFSLFPRSNETSTDEGEDQEEPRKTLMDYYDEAADSVLEEKGLEGTVLAWAKGWRNTCGKGAINKQVKVVKVASKDLLGKPGMSRKEYLKQLDSRITLHFSNLEPPPHNNLIIVTPVSPSTQLLLFDVATPSKPLPPPQRKIEYPARRKHERSLFERILAKMIDFAILAAACIGLVSLGKWGWKRYEAKKGSIRLPFTRNEEEGVLDLDAE